ncbi:MAG TPA: hypothetical protein VGN16_24020 [Acidobacteriaceae bacterium]|jgi:ankyrin repeat protein
MLDRTLPAHPSLPQYRKQAKELHAEAALGAPAALARIRRAHPKLRQAQDAQLQRISLADAQFVLAREHDFPSWAKFVSHIETLRVIRAVEDLKDPLNVFLEEASVPVHGWHAAGTLEHAELILARYGENMGHNIYRAAVLGDADAVRAELVRDPSSATVKGGPHGWDALTYLCFSRYLRLDKTRSDDFVAAARVLLEGGALANTGWMSTFGDPPHPEWESAIYGAAGLAQHPGVTALLLEFGADPNDGETPYHVPETYDNTTMKVILDSGRFDAKSLACLAARKSDWHDEDGLLLALEHGADPNFMTIWKHTPFHHAIRRDNGMIMIEMYLDHGADPLVRNNEFGRNAFQMCAYCGRGDILEAMEKRGMTFAFEGVDKLIALCARGDMTAVRELDAREPELRSQLLAMSGLLLVRYAGVGNLEGIRCLLALGADPATRYMHVEGYWYLDAGSTALHNAAWRARHDVVQELIAAGAPVNALDDREHTPLMMAVKACVDSYWKQRRKPDSVAALLAAGATTEGIDLPTGYDAIDELLERGS